MKIKEFNYRFPLKIIFLFLIFLFFCYTNVFAGAFDDDNTGVDSTKNENIRIWSDFEGGYVKYEYKFKQINN